MAGCAYRLKMTSRLKITPLTEKHACETFNGLRSAEIYTFIPDTPPPDLESLEKHYSVLVRGSVVENEKWLNWVVTEKHSEKVVGTLQSTIKMDEDAAYIAYVIFPQFWGKGYGFESTKWLMWYLQREEPVRKIIAEIDTRNLKSIVLIEKQGFKKIETVSTDEGKDHVYVRVIRR